VEALADRQPLVIVLDDLQWADAASLELLTAVVARSCPGLLIVATLRSTDRRRPGPLGATLAELARRPAVHELALHGLDDVEMSEFVAAAADQVLDEIGLRFAGTLGAATAGNPFFAGQVLRHLAESGALERRDGMWALTTRPEELPVPGSVRDVVSQRVNALGDDLARLLEAGAVAGSSFTATVLAAATDRPIDEALELLDRAERHALVVAEPADPTRYRFAHAIVGHTLTAEMSTATAVRLHRRIADALEREPDARTRAGEIAEHWARSPHDADRVRARRWATLAGDDARSAYAPVDARAWYQRAIELLGSADDVERTDILAARALAERDADDADYRSTLVAAGRLAVALGDPARVGAVVRAYGRSMYPTIGGWDSEFLAVLEEASHHPYDDATRAAVLIELAAQMRFLDRERALRLADDAVRSAQASGGATFGRVATLWSALVWAPGNAREVLDVLDRAWAQRDALEEPYERFMLARARAATELRLGRRDAWDAVLRGIDESSLATASPLHRWVTSYVLATTAFLDGRIADADALSEQVGRLGIAAGQPDARLIHDSFLVGVRVHQGRLGELVDRITAYADALPYVRAWRAAEAIAHLQAGDTEACRTSLTRLHAERGIAQRDFTWTSGTAWAAQACGHMGDRTIAADLYDELLPFADEISFQNVFVDGSIRRFLGILAATLGRLDEADDHFTAAALANEALRAPALIAATHLDHARCLERRGSPDDRARARALVETASRVADAHGLDALLEEARAQRALAP